MRTKCLILFAVLGLLLAWGGVASAATIVHNSTETYYSTGGTQVDDHLAANNDFTVGNTSGSQTWQVDEVVYHDTVAGTTQFSYTVRNLLLGSQITQFSLQNNGVQPLSFPAATAPAGWSFATSPTHWTWSVTTGSGISQGFSLNAMNVWVQGLVPVGYSSNTTIIAGTTQTSVDWVVSAPTPEPGTLFLIGAGLAAAGTWGRQTFFRTPPPQDAA